MTTTPHADDERCFFCASDEELSAALMGDPHPTIHMQTPPEACPHTDEVSR